jgi:hypothetical protein
MHNLVFAYIELVARRFRNIAIPLHNYGDSAPTALTQEECSCFVPFHSWSKPSPTPATQGCASGKYRIGWVGFVAIREEEMSKWSFASYSIATLAGATMLVIPSSQASAFTLSGPLLDRAALFSPVSKAFWHDKYRNREWRGPWGYRWAKHH